jgi:hypothetical protein
MTYDEWCEERERRAADRMRQVTEAGRMTQELLDHLGLKGSPGFMGRGVYGSGDRKPGYLAGRN